MKHLLLKSKCSIFYNIFKYMIFQRHQKALSWSLFDLIVYVPGNNLSVMLGQVFLGWTSTKQGLMRLAQRHNAVTLMRLEPVALPSRVKHSTTEPLHAHVMEQGSHRLEKYLNFEGFLEKSLKVKSALKSTIRNLSKALKGHWILRFSVGLSIVDRKKYQNVAPKCCTK